MLNKLKLSMLIFAGVLAFSSCSTTSTNDPVINNTVKTSGKLSVSATTSTYNGHYAPRHVLAVWVESSSGAFVKTLKLNAQMRKMYLTNWYNCTSSGNSTDALTGATLNSHSNFSCSWDGTDVSGIVVGDGSYNLCMELTEDNGTGKYAKFNFTKGTATDSQSAMSKSNFSDVNLNWTIH